MKRIGGIIAPIVLLYRFPVWRNIFHYHPLCAVDAPLSITSVKQFFATSLLVSVPNIIVV